MLHKLTGAFTSSLEYFILILILEYFIRGGGAGDHLPHL